jgi:AraC-like DNA-binding protein
MHLLSEENLALRPGVRVDVSVKNPTGRASRDPIVLLCDPPFHLEGKPLSAFLEYRANTYDTYDGHNQADGPDWYAIHFPEPTAVNCIEMTMECPNRDGGWWTSLTVEWWDGEWRSVDSLDIVPPYPFEDVPYGRRPYQTHALTFREVVTSAVRIIGLAGGLAQFTSLAHLAVYERDLSRWNPASLPQPPVPYLFRLIPPNSIWDLSESLVKLTGLSVSVAYMDHYLDQSRYERWWRRISSNYTGEPELWALLGMKLGWDRWNQIENPEEAQPAGFREPYVRLSFHNTIGRAAAPIIVDGQFLGEIISHQVIVKGQFDKAWHSHYARQHKIPWADYRAAVRRSPQMTLEQLEGAAMLMGMIANTIANLAHRNLNLEQQLVGARDTAERREAERHEIVRRAIDFMQDNLEGQMSVADVARHVALSPTYFGIIFREQMGRNPVDFLVELKVERAKEYLTHTPMSVLDVCVAVGYDPSYFNRLFKRCTGLTPGQYARKVRTGEMTQFIGDS